MAMFNQQNASMLQSIKTDESLVDRFHTAEKDAENDDNDSDSTGSSSDSEDEVAVYAL